MILLCRHEARARPLELRKKINPRLLELQMAKEILAEIFCVESPVLNEPFCV